jgi:ribonucleoside-diphosphate reductase alpha chain
MRVSEQSFHELNAMLNLWGTDGKIQFAKDKEAARQYFLQHVNRKLYTTYSLEEKLNYLFDNDYYERAVFDQYPFEFVKSLYKRVYAAKPRFSTFLGAFKFYTSYALKTFDGEAYLERYEDRIAVAALYLAEGNQELAESIADIMVSGAYQPATPTFLNAGKAQRGELVSCFLLRMEDNMESISRSINAALQLSKRGGGVAFALTNLREAGAPIKKIENQSSGVVPVMKLFEDSFSYANQLGARQGAGAVYLHANHPDIERFLDTKRENADEKIRIKTLSLGVVVPDIAFELAKNDEEMYLFSPYDVEKVYNKPFSEISVTEKYREMVDDNRIKKTKFRGKARGFFQTLAELQFESGYPYIMFEDTVNNANPIAGRVIQSNLCSEILQVSTASTYRQNLGYQHIGRDISCNLGSLNIAAAMDFGDLEKVVDTSVRALTAVSDMSDIESVPSIAKGNEASHAIGLGQMNLHGFLGRERIHYGSPESIDFVSSYFAAIAFYAIKASNKLAIERGVKFFEFEKSQYADGTFFDKYTTRSWAPKTDEAKAVFKKHGVKLPSKADWVALKDSVMEHGIYNAYLQAVPPTGSISYINGSTSSIHPITSKVEIRKEGKLGRVYYPAPGMDNTNLEFFEDAYELGYEKVIDVYAAATEHVDQGLSLTLFFKDTATTRDINRAQIYAWKKGIKTIYYIRLRQMALEGTDVSECVSCTL